MNNELLKKINAELKKTDIKGKEYVQVDERVRAFHLVCPDGSIETEIVKLEDGLCVMKATVKDEAGKILATGHAYEKEGSTLINQTSFIEQCETSAVGRALGFIGIGITGGIASCEEVLAAKINQVAAEKEPISVNQRGFIENLSKDPNKRKVAVEKLKSWGYTKLGELSKIQASELITELNVS